MNEYSSPAQGGQALRNLDLRMFLLTKFLLLYKRNIHVWIPFMVEKNKLTQANPAETAPSKRDDIMIEGSV